MTDNPYKVLGVAPDATAQQIKSARRKCLIATHPDHGGARADYDAVQSAGRLIGDESTREEYDRQRDAAARKTTRTSQAPSPPQGWEDDDGPANTAQPQDWRTAWVNDEQSEPAAPLVDPRGAPYSRLFTTSEACVDLGIDPAQMENWIAVGEIIPLEWVNLQPLWNLAHLRKRVVVLLGLTGPEPPLLTTRQAAKGMGVSANHLRRWAKDGHVIPSLVMPDGELWWRLDSLQRQTKDWLRK